VEEPKKRGIAHGLSSTPGLKRQDRKATKRTLPEESWCTDRIDFDAIGGSYRCMCGVPARVRDQFRTDSPYAGQQRLVCGHDPSCCPMFEEVSTMHRAADRLQSLYARKFANQEGDLTLRDLQMMIPIDRTSRLLLHAVSPNTPMAMDGMMLRLPVHYVGAALQLDPTLSETQLLRHLVWGIPLPSLLAADQALTSLVKSAFLTILHGELLKPILQRAGYRESELLHGRLLGVPEDIQPPAPLKRCATVAAHPLSVSIRRGGLFVTETPTWQWLYTEGAHLLMYRDPQTGAKRTAGVTIVLRDRCPRDQLIPTESDLITSRLSLLLHGTNEWFTCISDGSNVVVQRYRNTRELLAKAETDATRVQPFYQDKLLPTWLHALRGGQPGSLSSFLPESELTPSAPELGPSAPELGPGAAAGEERNG